jgi:uncharacterized protein YceK
MTVGERRARLVLAALAVCVALAGCGSTYSGISSQAAPPAADFPKPAGTLADVYKAADGESKLVVLPTGMVFDKGTDRYGFGVFTASKEQITDAKVALYFAHGEDGKAMGPYPARIESLATKSAFIAQTTGQDPAAAKVVYVTDSAPFTSAGEWRALAMVREGDKLEATLMPSAVVGHFQHARPGFPKTTANPPDVGQKAPDIHTPTAADVGGDLAKIDTRIPPDDMHEDLAKVLGRKPVVLVFATPQFCQSRICGPVVDEEEQVKQGYGSRVAFIHMEIYKENNPAKGVRPQVAAFRLPSEPWTFVIDRDGIVRARFEGALSVAEMEEAVAKVAGKASG